MSFDYKNSKKRILDILDSKTDIVFQNNIPSNESEFTYENGIYTKVASLFLDIRNSSSFFKENKKDKVARIMRSYYSEIITILTNNKNYREIGIRGDCIYACYTAPKPEDVNSICNDAIWIFTFDKMFQEILRNKDWPTFEIGIGLGYSDELIVKAGKKGTGINNNIWIGNAVVNSCKLSSLGNKNGLGFNTIVMDKAFYEKLFYYNEKTANFFTKKYSSDINEYVYHGKVVFTDFNDWIENGMKNE